GQHFLLSVAPATSILPEPRSIERKLPILSFHCPLRLFFGRIDRHAQHVPELFPVTPPIVYLVSIQAAVAGDLQSAAAEGAYIRDRVTPEFMLLDEQLHRSDHNRFLAGVADQVRAAC